ncbi:MAG TPA: glycosyltransferase [Thermoanaerobaculia bacterium]
MASIAFLIEHEEGHLNPTFKLARRLAGRGHSVVYWGLPDGESYVRRQGFAYHPLAGDLFPRGSLKTQREIALEAQSSGAAAAAPGVAGLPWGGTREEIGRYWKEAVCGPIFADALAAGRPDLVLVTSFFSALGLVLQYRYRLRVALLTPLLRTHSKRTNATQVGQLVTSRLPGTQEFLLLLHRADPALRGMEDLTARVMGMRELILCPEQLELPGQSHAREPEVHYVEPSLDLERRSEHAFPWERIDPSRRLLYASLGSQSYRAEPERVRRFFHAVVDAFSDRPDWQVVLSTSGLFDADSLSCPNGGIVTAWAPQVQLLARAAVMLTHGGLGTVKECIYQGVPMVVFPVSHDQPDNARRVVHHGLGVLGDLDRVAAPAVASLVAAADDPALRRTLAPFTARFRALEEDGPAVRLLEDLLAQPLPFERAAPAQAAVAAHA